MNTYFYLFIFFGGGAGHLLIIFHIRVAIKARDDREVMKEATFISSSAAPTDHGALSSTEHRERSTNLILWMKTSRGGGIGSEKIAFGQTSDPHREVPWCVKWLHICIRVMMLSVSFGTSDSDK